MASGDTTFKHLSGGTDGKPIAVAATTTPGTTIHTPSTTSPDIEFVTLWAVNKNTASAIRTLTMEWGGTAAGQTWTIQLAPNRGMVLIADRLPITGAANLIRAYADVANEVLIQGRVVKSEEPT